MDKEIERVVETRNACKFHHTMPDKDPAHPHYDV